MKKSILVLLIPLVSSVVFCQKLHFVYIQSEPEQPFFVKISEKIHSSTSSGYLILSRLRDSSYAISLGFPQGKWPEQRFTIEMKAKDHGYSLRNFGDKGWGLYDMETMAIQMARLPNNNSVSKIESKDVSVFTEILSKAANDPTLKEKPVIAKEEKTAGVQPQVVREEVKVANDSAVVKKDQPLAVKREEPAFNNREEDSVERKENERNTPAVERYKPSVVSKKSESSSTQGLTLTFIDDYGNGQKDTVRIIIPNQKTNPAETGEPLKEEIKFLDMPEADTVKKTEADPDAGKQENPPAAATAKNNCTSTATDKDFLNLRKKMAAANGDDAMVNEARKIFRTKCFSTLQVKNLSTLFLNDAGKYKFFDAAYAHVNDPDNFTSLSGEMKDEYYLNRFKAMLRQ